MATMAESGKYTPDGCAIWTRVPLGAGIPPMVTVASHNQAIEAKNDEINQLRAEIDGLREAAGHMPAPTEATDDPAAALLAEALATVTGPRRASYGTPVDNFEATAALWNAYLNGRRKRSEAVDLARRTAAEGEDYPIDQRPLFKRGRIVLDAVDVAVLMDLLKTARLIVSPGHRDNWLDKAGYAACGWFCADADSLSTRPTTSKDT